MSDPGTSGLRREEVELSPLARGRGFVRWLPFAQDTKLSWTCPRCQINNWLQVRRGETVTSMGCRSCGRQLVYGEEVRILLDCRGEDGWSDD